MTEGAAFCPNCGARNDPGPALGVPPTDPAGGLQETSGAVRERKKKVNIKGIAYGVLALVVGVYLIYALVQSGKTDYVGSVKQYYKPFESLGYSYTCGQVFGRYMPNADWSVSENDNGARVTVSGPFLDASTFEVRFDVEPMQNDDDRAYYSVASGMVDGEVASKEETSSIMAFMWEAYDEGLTLEEFDALYS